MYNTILNFVTDYFRRKWWLLYRVKCVKCVKHVNSHDIIINIISGNTYLGRFYVWRVFFYNDGINVLLFNNRIELFSSSINFISSSNRIVHLTLFLDDPSCLGNLCQTIIRAMKI